MYSAKHEARESLKDLELVWEGGEGETLDGLDKKKHFETNLK